MVASIDASCWSKLIHLMNTTTMQSIKEMQKWNKSIFMINLIMVLFTIRIKIRIMIIICVCASVLYINTGRYISSADVIPAAPFNCRFACFQFVLRVFSRLYSFSVMKVRCKFTKRCDASWKRTCECAKTMQKL